MRGREELRLGVISTEGPARPGRNGEISRRTKGAPGRGPDSSIPLRSAQDDKGGEGSAHSAGVASGFTLIELLVVISIVVLLMALLLPALSGARKQARAVVCQSRLHDWSLLFAAYQNDNDGCLPDGGRFVWDGQTGEGEWRDLSWPVHMELYSRLDLHDAMLCPTASKPVPSDASWATRGTDVFGGTTFLAWRFSSDWRGDIEATIVPQYEYFGSYAMNRYLTPHGSSELRKKRPATRPTFFDCRVSYAGLLEAASDEPPPCADFEMGANLYFRSSQVTINRHQGGINMLFGDGAIRRVGVKELWTLRWRNNFDTTGPWTKAGGVTPGDWPAWMRRFKDY